LPYTYIRYIDNKILQHNKTEFDPLAFLFIAAKGSAINFCVIIKELCSN